LTGRRGGLRIRFMKVKAVLFDLDGTLTVPILDFDRIRSEIGEIEGPILEAMEKMTPAERQRAEEILHRHEEEAAVNSQLNPGVRQVWSYLRGSGRLIGLITRNRRWSVEKFSQTHNLSFDSIFTREDGPAKPDPYPVRQVCRELEVQPEEALVVGDYLFDLISGRRAGARSVLLSSGKKYADYVHEADYVIARLDEVIRIIEDIEK